MKNQTQNHYQMEAETIMRPYTRTYATVNLDAVRYNLKAMKANLNRGTGIIGVVKADAYGHGAVPVARAIDEDVCGGHGGGSHAAAAPRHYQTGHHSRRHP